MSGRKLVARLRIACDLNRNEVERLQRVAIGDIARARERNTVAGIEIRRQRQDQCRRCAAGEHEPVGIDVEAIRPPVVAREAGLQFRLSQYPMLSVSRMRWARSIAFKGAPVDGWPYSI